MMISSYNKDGIGDVLLVMTESSVSKEQGFETKGNTTRIFNTATNKTVGYNFFESSDYLEINENGPLTLSMQQVSCLNDRLLEQGFIDQLEADEAPKFVVGYVKECSSHPNSDHLSITQIEIDNQQVIQVVCGAANIAAGQKVVVAKVGAMMPDGTAIWDGELRGEPSHGMVCSAKELGIKEEQGKKGILVLSDSSVVGTEFKK
jgi:tRNA-binding protein